MSISSVPIYDIRSPVCQGITCVPVVGHLSALFARLVILAVKKKEGDKNDVNRKVLIVKMSIEYNKIGVARNVLTVALAAGAVALGILSAPTGAILASAHLVWALTNLYSIRKDNQELNNLPRTASV